MNEKRAKGVLIVAFIWCVLIAALAVAYKFLVAPYLQGRLEGETGSQSQYQHTIHLAADSFSGYAVLRSGSLRDQLKAKGIKLEVEDDAADYIKRIKALRDGRIQMAVFTIDSLLTSGVAIGEFPATIVLVLDETKGADAIVAYKEAVASIQDLDDPEARIVATPNSPSEFLARVVLAHFSLPQLPEKWLIEADGAGEVYQEFRKADRATKRAYVLWEPYVSMALGQTGAHILLDSGKMSGLIVDVLVAQRKFLTDHPDVVREVIEAYLRAAYSHSQQSGGMTSLLIADARETGSERLSQDQAQTLVDGIEWKNTMENYGHFGLLPNASGETPPHLEDMISRIADVLVKTGAIPNNPVEGKANTLFYDQVLRDLQASGFHPAKKLNVLEDVGLNSQDLTQARAPKALPKLTDEQWNSLVPVGEMRVPPISFARGTAQLNIQSDRELRELAMRLNSLPQYYLVVVGHARAEGDPEANLRLAQERADAAAQAFRNHGVNPNRIKVKAAKPSAQNGSAQAVSFVVGQVPY